MQAVTNRLLPCEAMPWFHRACTLGWEAQVGQGRVTTQLARLAGDKNIAKIAENFAENSPRVPCGSFSEDRRGCKWFEDRSGP